MKAKSKTLVREILHTQVESNADGHKIVKIPYGSNNMQRLKALVMGTLNFDGTGTIALFSNLSRFEEQYSKFVTPAGAPTGFMSTPNANAFNAQWGVLSTGNQNVTGTFRQQYYTNGASVAYDTVIKSEVGNDIEDCLVIVFIGAATGVVRLAYHLEYEEIM